MVDSAKVVFSTIDRSNMFSADEGMHAAIVVNSDKGQVNVPTLVTSESNLISLYGTPNPSKGISMLSAMIYFNVGGGNKLWVVRAAHKDIKFASALVRSKIGSIPKDPTNTINDECLIVKPISGGLTQEEIDSYVFNNYLTNKIYIKPKTDLVDNIVSTGTDLTTFRVTDSSYFSEGDYISVDSDGLLDALNSPNDSYGEDEPTFKIQKVYDDKVVYENLHVSKPVTAKSGTEIFLVDSQHISEEDENGVTRETVLYKRIAFPKHPKLVRDAQGSAELLVDDTDLIPDDAMVCVGGEVDNSYVNLEALQKLVDQQGGILVDTIKKSPYIEVGHCITIEGNLDATKDKVIYKVQQSEFEKRDSFLVYALYPGKWGNDVTVNIKASEDYENAFIIETYYKGVKMESFEVTKTHQLDGFGRQMYIEDVINGKSGYIKVISNPDDVDDEGNLRVPLTTNYSLWVQDPDDVWNQTECLLAEELLQGHTEVKVTSVKDLELGTRIRFPLGKSSDGTLDYSAEYKITAIDSENLSITLDRKIVEEYIERTWIDNEGDELHTFIAKFDSKLYEPENGIIAGIKYYPIKTIDNTIYPLLPVGSKLTISGLDGTLLSSGANLFEGGNDGSTVTTADAITALNKLKNSERTPVELLMEGGWTDVAYKQAMLGICSAQDSTQAYCSVTEDSEDSFVALDDTAPIVASRQDTNLNSDKISIFSGWLKVFDSYNQIARWVAPDAFAAGIQSFVTAHQTPFIPAAGWNRGGITALDVKCKFDEGQRDILTNHQINVIRYDINRGMAIWGNETTLTKPSPLQMRSVAMLLIYLKVNLKPLPENTLFDPNNESTYSILQNAIDNFMEYRVKAKNGVTEYKTLVSAVTSDVDRDNRVCNIFLGIKPTSDINRINFNINVFNQTMEITV